MGILRVMVLFLVFIFISPTLVLAWEGDLKIGIEQYRAENFEEAFEYLYRARQQNRQSAVIAFYLGLAYKQTGDYEKAVEYFEDALRLKPPVVEAYGEIIEVLNGLDKIKEALQWISKAEAAKVEPSKIAFLKGLIFMKTSESSKAIEAFERAKALDPTTSQAADLQIAIAYSKQKKISLAIKSLKAVVATNPNTELAQFAREYEAVFSRSIEGYRAVRLSAGLSFVYDTNVTAKPSTDIGLPASNEKDSGIMGNFNVNFNPFIEGDWLFAAQYALSATFYRKLTAYNSLSQSFSVVPGYSLKNGTITMPISYSHNLLNGEGYMATVTAKPTLSYMLIPGHITSVYVAYSHRNMIQEALDPDEERDANLISAGIGHMYPFSDGRGLLGLRYEYVIDNTKGTNWKSRGSRFNISIISPIVDGLDFTAALDAYLQDYRNDNTIFLIKRSDKIYNINVGLAYEFIKGLYANAQFAYTKAQSNIALYDYKKNLFIVGLEYRF
jgi:tetratricopeptide (TPR) repeat protein